MDGSFNGQILVDKLAKLNNSQQSIETLSHWCIFHRKKAKQVVETWDRQFYCSPQDQRVSFLYLANDILQNSRRKGMEFVNEFWKVLPDALSNVVENGDEFGRNAALRLIDIWEERKVFGSRGQVLKEELLGRNLESRNRNGKSAIYKLKQPAGGMLEKLFSSYEHVHEGSVNEDAMMGKCQDAISHLEKFEKDIGNDVNSESPGGSRVVEELQEKHAVLRECIEQLKAVESSRATLLSLLREALHEQEFKFEQVRNQLQAAQLRYEQVGDICQHLLGSKIGHSVPDKRTKESAAPYSDAPPGYIPESKTVAKDKEELAPVPGYIPESKTVAKDKEELAPVRYTQQGNVAGSPRDNKEEHRKTEAAAVAAKLAASTSSAQMLSYVLSSLASEGVIGQTVKEDYSSDNKKAKLENGVAAYIPPQPQPPPPPFPHPDSLYQPQPPPMPPALPPTPPPPPPATTATSSSANSQFAQSTGSMSGVSYSYGLAPLQRPAPISSYPMVSIPPFPAPPNPYHGFQPPEASSLFNQPPMPAGPPPMPQQ